MAWKRSGVRIPIAPQRSTRTEAAPPPGGAVVFLGAGREPRPDRAPARTPDLTDRAGRRGPRAGPPSRGLPEPVRPAPEDRSGAPTATPASQPPRGRSVARGGKRIPRGFPSGVAVAGGGRRAGTAQEVGPVPVAVRWRGPQRPRPPRRGPPRGRSWARGARDGPGTTGERGRGGGRGPGPLTCRSRWSRRASGGGDTGCPPRAARDGRSTPQDPVELFLPQGAMAQLVARFHGMEEVWGSNPHSSTPRPARSTDSVRPPRGPVAFRGASGVGPAPRGARRAGFPQGVRRPARGRCTGAGPTFPAGGGRVVSGPRRAAGAPRPVPYAGRRPPVTASPSPPCRPGRDRAPRAARRALDGRSGPTARWGPPGSEIFGSRGTRRTQR